jgi:hypothetical protein
MSVRSELAITYDGNMRPVSAKCTECGEQMSSPGPELESSAEIILWMAGRFLEHKRASHPASSRIEADEIDLQ